ncbi:MULTISPECIES: transporter substrate-binding domain-containing protein [Modicisalibacter]|uniref:transporter substrate-binding domain-containing protein n=1 Tax=Modicisalibacter TaxID=574347 RepID=UPI00100ADA02|nr:MULTISPECIES: transporter substrate-binding domain-containing protein [Halomonadaceae]MBZ9558921.1 transporter substrate-binding domain-containing protein [Modicisalibacter sp. R2A 31.J]MBZ9575187.1 transporter substrate-binding domain-containing protein [Modicisalibacter sp. MOD 31.J]
MSHDESAAREILAPDGVLRAAINYGNPVLAQRGDDGRPQGVSAALAAALAERLGVPVDYVTFDAAGKVVASVDDAQWCVAFLARDPRRAEALRFTEPYVVIEGTYLVPEESAFHHVEELDRDGVRIAVGEGAAYDLYLTRTLTHAELVRAPTSADAIDAFVEQGLAAAAGVRQPLERFAATHPGYRVLAGRFTAIEQCMALPKRCAGAGPYVDAFIQEMIDEGFVARQLD